MPPPAPTTPEPPQKTSFATPMSYKRVDIFLLLTTLLTTVATATTSLTPAQGRGTLLQVQVIARHGARTALTKTATSLLEGGAALTPIGEKQLYDLGVWLRERYKHPLHLDLYESGKIHLQSSDFDRTVVSASSMALGLFPKLSRSHANTTVLLPPDITPANVPVHTKDRLNDVDIRGYTLCPLIKTRLDALYDDATFLNIESANEPLLMFLGKHKAFEYYTKDGKVELKELWNVYDSINVAKTECDCLHCNTAPTCLALPDSSIKDYLTDTQWQHTIQTAHAVEHLKFGKETTESLIGANILKTVLTRMGSTPNQPDDERRRLAHSTDPGTTTTVNPKTLEHFIYFSSHYPTILGVFSTLNLIELNPNTPVSDGGIPDYASALLFELWRSSNDEYEVVAVFKDGDTLTSLVLPCQTVNNEPCTLVQFAASIAAITSKDSVNSDSQWCTKCQNNVSDICMKETLIKYQINGGWSNFSIVVAAFVSMVLSIGGTVCCCLLFQKHNKATNASNPRVEMSMGTRHGSKRADIGMERLKEEEEDEVFDDRI